MVHPKEVRVGNWVIKITGTDANTQSFFEYKAIPIDEYYYTFAKVCFPIKITAAILQNSGFKQDSGDWYIDRPGAEGQPFLRYHHAEACWYVEKTRLWSQPLYVHQLQNLFYALSHEELDIQLGSFENLPLLGPIDLFVKPLPSN
ncbi:MAG: hypothetical protein ACXVBR_04170 [Flavisolibacter sp.]